jgi:tRNA-specific 2-thiouridylase
LGGMSKPEVRAHARSLGLDVADKHDSQDICFVPQGRYADLVRRMHPEAQLGGEIVHLDGRVLGRHQGIVNFTVGQRRGIGVATGEALYVIRLDHRASRVVVGPREALTTTTVRLRDVNWLGDLPLADATAGNGLRVEVRVRSTRSPTPGAIHCDDRNVRVTLFSPEYGIAAGQACVFYADESPTSQVLGGGFIAEAVPQTMVA